MKQIIATFILLVIAGIAAHVVVASIRSRPVDLHWLDTIVVAATSTAVLALNRKYTKR